MASPVAPGAPPSQRTVPALPVNIRTATKVISSDFSRPGDKNRWPRARDRASWESTRESGLLSRSVAQGAGHFGGKEVVCLRVHGAECARGRRYGLRESGQNAKNAATKISTGNVTLSSALASQISYS